MFASSGEITAPCGVPSSDARHSPSSEVPAVSHFRMSLITPLVADSVFYEPD
ncbi:Uncharacterised protein [Klebsiella pneumoniae]|uniref:Uncharacterized protein n=1 Tax=Klebsiella pneumoniae TaxID=573 RepID=A0A2X3F1Y2_KLEPN|nr:Uncharacterised protein [Klebsiella pneumoniae]